MEMPQQPELRRSERGDIDPKARHAKEKVSKAPREDEARGPVPEESQPGHRPDREQDRPEV